MPKLKGLIAAIAAVSLAFALPNAAIAELLPELENYRLNQDEMLILVSEGGYRDLQSQLTVQPPGVEEGQTRGEWQHCKDMADPICATNDSSKDILAWSVLADCTQTTSPICLEGLTIGSVGSAPAAAKLVGSADQSQYRLVFPADEKTGLIAGATTPIYEATMGGKTSLFSVAVKPTQHFDYKVGKFVVTDLDAQVVPISTTQPGAARSCVTYFNNACAYPADFAPGTTVGIKFRMSKQVGGWFSGRMKAPNIAVSSYSETLNLIDVSAEAVVVPALAMVRKKSDFSSKEMMWWNNHGRFSRNGGEATGANTWQPDVFEFIEYFRPLVKDTSAGEHSVWSMASRQSGSSAGSDCLTDTSKVLGIVSTNALGYAGGSPTFDAGSLEYKVAGLHYAPDGKTLNEGTYDLVMRSETARCLYGFSKAPISAKVQVVGEGGENKVATVIVSEDAKTGWLKMAAYGFTFSSPTIMVKLSQAKAPAKKITITCTKGKLTKKVTAVAAKCPAGYKKK